MCGDVPHTTGLKLAKFSQVSDIECRSYKNGRIIVQKQPKGKTNPQLVDLALKSAGKLAATSL
jgi:hypothetical protein